MRRWTRRQVLRAGALATVSALTAACQPQRTLPETGTTENAAIKLIRREAWGALDPNLDAAGEHGLFHPVTNPSGWLVYTVPLAEVLNTVVVHHSALSLSDGPIKIQKLHFDQKGYADVGYHFLVDEVGKVYEGRKINVRGAHTGGYNTGTIGVVLLGNFELAAPPNRQLHSAKDLIRLMIAQYGITHLAGHRDFQPDETVCPGAYLEPLLPGLAVELGLTFGTEGYKKPEWAGEEPAPRNNHRYSLNKT